MRADFKKIKYTFLVWVHLVLPVLCALIFIAYFSYSRERDPLHLYTFYMEAIGMAFPLLIGVICGMAVSQEEQAGKFQVLLGAVSRLTSYSSKLVMLLIMGMISVFLALGFFVIGLKYVLHLQNIRYSVFLEGGVLLMVSMITLYMIHLLASYLFGMGFSSVLGGAGFLLAGLMLTGIGDHIWQYIPWAWGARFMDYIGTLQLRTLSMDEVHSLQNEMNSGKNILIYVTIIVFIISVLWFRLWEGRKSYE
nr:lantibiotic immunity ABC transporter MutG family permease subunit [Paenibacillus sp. 23TSA30-6]